MSSMNLLDLIKFKKQNYCGRQKNKNWNDVFFLNILKKKSRKNYLDKIGFNHSLKTEKLKRCFS